MLKEKLMEDLKKFMKEKNQIALNTVKLLRSEIKKAEIDTQKELNDDEIIKIIKKQVKMRNESIKQFKDAGRNDLVVNEEKEIAFLKNYLPEEMSEEEIKNIISSIIKEMNATPKQFGLVMKTAIQKIGNQADGSIISKIVKEILG
ncbi:hypothetical protein OSSY52_19920 [Tepiditoga spiralis]|uniref:Aspartyl-tRNA amidotransferase subunit B n=1 Tax=Tepiditoga spiralis TaxID=2108365 RepID=A0A7G1G5Z8_9BACT|nr:GatB/YqeY domain-containing protein [Tepiditoga spiralis]BBE31851.1 hypothetical protein OSSY52_19920 [Tepiditoga spiralis]